MAVALVRYPFWPTMLQVLFQKGKDKNRIVWNSHEAIRLGQ